MMLMQCRKGQEEELFFCAIYIKVRDVKIKERGGEKNPSFCNSHTFFMGLDAVMLNKTVTVKKITNLFVQQSSNMQQDLVLHEMFR